MKYYGTAAYSSPDWGMERYYAQANMKQLLDVTPKKIGKPIS